jgi:hypothetical protein
MNGRDRTNFRQDAAIFTAPSLAGHYHSAFEQVFELRWLGAMILFGCMNLSAQRRGGVPRPARVIEDCARQGDHVSIAGRNDRLGLLEAGDEPNGNHRHANRRFDRTGQRYLIAWTDRNLLCWVQAAT